MQIGTGDVTWQCVASRYLAVLCVEFAQICAGSAVLVLSGEGSEELCSCELRSWLLAKKPPIRTLE